MKESFVFFSWVVSCGGITGPVHLTLRYFFHRSLAYLRLGTPKYMYPHCSARTNFSLCRTRYFLFFSTHKQNVIENIQSKKMCKQALNNRN